MRRRDKLKNIEKLNKRLNENRFSWDGTFANEDCGNDEVSEVFFGNDFENDVDEDCGCALNQPEPSDVKNSQWFSDVDGERIMDKDDN